MFRRSSEGIWRSTLLEQFQWLEHGFGTRHTTDWPGGYTRVRQVHSATVVVAESIEGHPPEGDALVATTPGRWVGIRTADCVPVLFADGNQRVVGAVHAGWRGTVAGVLREAVETMRREFRSSPEDLVAAIGPCIGRCCFEVGQEVGQQFRPMFPNGTDLSRIDLVEANRGQLLSSGLLPENIDASGQCTVCDEGEFHSWRRDREQAGRMITAIRIALVT